MLSQQSVIFHIQEYKDSILSPTTAAVEKLSNKLVDKLTQDFQHFRGNMLYTSPVGPLFLHLTAGVVLPKRGYRRYTPQGTLRFYQQDHREDSRKWDEQSTLILGAQVQEVQGETTTVQFFSRVIAAPVSSRQFSRQNGRSWCITDPMERSSSPFLHDVSGESWDQSKAAKWCHH